MDVSYIYEKVVGSATADFCTIGFSGMKNVRLLVSIDVMLNIRRRRGGGKIFMNILFKV